MRAWKRKLLKVGMSKFFLGGVGFIACEVNAASSALDIGDISNSYSNCTFRDNGNGTATVSVTVDYKKTPRSPATGNEIYAGRGLMFYAYDKNGRLQQSSFAATSVKLDGVEYFGKYIGVGYSIYQHNYAYYPWNNRAPFVGTFTAVIPDSILSAWPAVSLRAANVGYASSANDMAEIKGAAYIARTSSNDGSCRVIVNPETPPPLDINLSVSAPDWNLGDLQQGSSDTRLPRADQMLCFSYNVADVQGQKFIIGASNANGVVNSRYRLMHLSDTSQVVPYSLTLDSGSSIIKLPANNIVFPLEGTGRTCFVPTFTTEVDKTLKEGDYSDVLNFTVTTKS